ncbi:hypothetical protein RFI_08510, partial [Reticulomyxa filosa]
MHNISAVNKDSSMSLLSPMDEVPVSCLMESWERMAAAVAAGHPSQVRLNGIHPAWTQNLSMANEPATMLMTAATSRRMITSHNFGTGLIVRNGNQSLSTSDNDKHEDDMVSTSAAGDKRKGLIHVNSFLANSNVNGDMVKEANARLSFCPPDNVNAGNLHVNMSVPTTIPVAVPVPVPVAVPVPVSMPNPIPLSMPMTMPVDMNLDADNMLANRELVQHNQALIDRTFRFDNDCVNDRGPNANLNLHDGFMCMNVNSNPNVAPFGMVKSLEGD